LLNGFKVEHVAAALWASETAYAIALYAVDSSAPAEHFRRFSDTIAR
jgi:hypothetical protein